MAKTVSTPATATGALQVRPRYRFLLFQKLAALFNRRESITKTTSKKVLFVANADSFINLFCLPYMRYFKQRGYKVHVATGTLNSVEYCDRKIDLSLKRSPYRFFSNLRAVRQLKKVINQEHYQIIHCHTPVGGVVARLAARKFRKNSASKVIYTAHGFHFYNGAPLSHWLLFYPIEKWLAKYTDTLITINQEDYARARHDFAERCAAIRYIQGVGVDEQKIAERLSAAQKIKLRKQLNLKNRDFIISCIARLDKNKNQGFVITAISKLVQQYPQIHLLLVGDDEVNGKYQRLATKLGVEQNVHFLGFREDVGKLIQISDLIVSASKREGLPLNIIEAIAYKKPVLASNNRGHRDILMCGPYGYLFEEDDIDSFCYLVGKFITQNSHTNITNFYLKNTLRKTAQIYRDAGVHHA